MKPVRLLSELIVRSSRPKHQSTRVLPRQAPTARKSSRAHRGCTSPRPSVWVTTFCPHPEGAVRMCGIVGFTGRREASPVLLEGLRRLEYRGYDSAGMVTGTGNQL